MELMMNLFQALGLNEKAYWQLREKKKSITGGALVVGAVGLVYGLVNYFLFRELLTTMMNSKASIITGTIAIIMSGLSIAFLAHGGIVLLIWAISKGFKGPGNFALLYGNIGVAMAPLMIAAPLASYIWLAEKGLLAYLMVVPFIAWFWVVSVQAVRAAEGHSYGRATGVLLTTTIFSISLLYLWSPR